MIDCFISHVWRQSPQWISFEQFLYNDKKIEWRNFSLPWHDPALKVGDGLGKELLLKNLTNQIIPAKIFFLLESLYEKKSNLFWLNFQIKLAEKEKIQIVLIPFEDLLDIKVEFKYIKIDNSYESLHKMVNDLNIK